MYQAGRMSESRVFGTMIRENLPFGELVACNCGDIARRSRLTRDRSRFLRKYHAKLYYRHACCGGGGLTGQVMCTGGNELETLKIRRAEAKELDRIMQIYDHAHRFMEDNGNGTE